MLGKRVLNFTHLNAKLMPVIFNYKSFIKGFNVYILTLPCRSLFYDQYKNRQIAIKSTTNIQINVANHFSKEVGNNEKEEAASIEQDESEDEHDESEVEPAYFNRTFADDKHLPFNFRERKHVLKSMRIDSVICSGLNISKSKVSELFLSSKIKLNGRKVLKKSIKLQEGDYVDTSMVEDSKPRVKRVRVLGVVDGGEGRCDAYLRSWKGGIERVGRLEGGNWQ